MHILIDGYNLIRQSINLRRFERQSLEAGRKALIAWLSEYRNRKDHRITVVFDSWESGQPQEERGGQGSQQCPLVTGNAAELSAFSSMSHGRAVLSNKSIDLS